MTTSRHYSEERADREARIALIGEGEVVDRFVVDRGHRNGPEVHELTTTAIIKVYNQRSGKLVTKMIARPGQIKRYYAQGKAPKAILNRAYENVQMGWNY